MSRLQRWGPAATARMLTTDSELCEPQIKALLDILDFFKNPQVGNITACPPVPEKWKVACCLPYVLSYLSKKDGCRSLDLSKPILMLATTEVTLSRLEKKLSTQESHGAMAFFRDNGLLTELEIENDAFYHVYCVKSRLDMAEMKEVASRHEIVLTDLQYCSNIPRDSFSAVLVYGNHQLSLHQLELLKNNFGQDMSIVLFAASPYAFQENKNSAKKSEDTEFNITKGKKVGTRIVLQSHQQHDAAGVEIAEDFDAHPTPCGLEVKELPAGSTRRHKGFFWSLIKRKSKSSHSGQDITDRDASSNMDVVGQDGNEKRRRRSRRWGRKARPGRYDNSDVSPLISSGRSEEELEEEESGVLEQAHGRCRRGSRKMNGIEDGAEASIRSVPGRQMEVYEGRKAKGFLFRRVFS